MKKITAQICNVVKENYSNCHVFKDKSELETKGEHCDCRQVSEQEPKETEAHLCCQKLLNIYLGSYALHSNTIVKTTPFVSIIIM